MEFLDLGAAFFYLLLLKVFSYQECLSSLLLCINYFHFVGLFLPEEFKPIVPN